MAFLSKTQNSFSLMPLDQAHEQENIMIKMTCGGLYLT